GQAFCHRFACEQPGADHDVGVRRIGAGGDGGNDDVAMAEIVLAALDRYPLRRAGLGEVLVERGSERGMEIEDVLAPGATLLDLLAQRNGEACLAVLEGRAVLRTLGS